MINFVKSEVINIPTIKGPITFKAGKDLPEKFKESLKKEKIDHLPFKMKKQKKKPEAKGKGQDKKKTVKKEIKKKGK